MLNDFDETEFSDLLSPDFCISTPLVKTNNSKQFIAKHKVMLAHMRVISTAVLTKNDTKFEFHFVTEMIDNYVKVKTRIPCIAIIIFEVDLIKSIKISYHVTDRDIEQLSSIMNIH